MRKISDYENNIRELQWQNEQLNRKMRDNQYNDKKLPEYENRLVLMSQEIDRLNSNLRTKM